MSYVFIQPCYYCEKKENCKDTEKIQKAINEIHTTTDGSHLGSGSVILLCTKMISTVK